MPEQQPDTDLADEEERAEGALPAESDETGGADADRADATTSDGYEPL